MGKSDIGQLVVRAVQRQEAAIVGEAASHTTVFNLSNKDGWPQKVSFPLTRLESQGFASFRRLYVSIGR